MKTLQLTARTVNSATRPGHYGDGSGLYMQISAFGTKAWVFRFMLHGRSREMGLGSLNTFTLTRERARAARQLVADGIEADAPGSCRAGTINPRWRFVSRVSAERVPVPPVWSSPPKLCKAQKPGPSPGFFHRVEHPQGSGQGGLPKSTDACA
ncbi:MAG: Arm DNA-binding domain-containing protein [Methyloceanibacter sp.]